MSTSLSYFLHPSGALTYITEINKRRYILCSQGVFRLRERISMDIFIINRIWSMITRRCFSPLSILLWLACGERNVRGSALSGRTGWIQQNEINTRRYRSTWRGQNKDLGRDDITGKMTAMVCASWKKPCIKKPFIL